MLKLQRAAVIAVQAALAVLAYGPAHASAAVIHVAPGGDDAATGSQSAPLRSLQRAVTVVRPGDQVLVAPGTYEGFRMTTSGTAASPISISAVPGAGRPTITPSGSSNSVVLLDGVRDVRLSGLEVTGNPTRWGAGIRVRGGSSRVELSDLDVHHNRSFGVLLEDVTDTLVAESRLHRNETGLQVSRVGAGVRILGNDVYDNDRMIVDDEQPGNDRGANAMVFFRTTGPVTVADNRAWGNRARSTDFGYDGGAFEVYAASGLTIRDNVVWNNQNVMETGTDRTLPCAGNSFTGNVAYGGVRTGPAMGLILRCASDMVVANNTLDDLDKFAIDVTAAASSFGGSIEGLSVVRNIAVSGADKQLSIDSALPPSVTIDENLVFNRRGGYIAYVAGRGNTRSLSTFTAWTGLQVAGIQADPLFVDHAAADFRLRAETPAATWGAGKALELARQGGACQQAPAACAPPGASSPSADPALAPAPEPSAASTPAAAKRRTCAPARTGAKNRSGSSKVRNRRAHAKKKAPARGRRGTCRRARSRPSGARCAKRPSASVRKRAKSPRGRRDGAAAKRTRRC